MSDDAALTPAYQNAPYPWQLSHWQQLLGRRQAGRLPHALLLAGPGGSGKKDFADAFAAYLLCAEPGEKGACGSCRSCKLVAAQSHPDWVRIVPEEPGKALKIDQIRSLGSFIGQTAQQGGHKVVLIAPAEAMNVYAANALLKNLEEPSADTTLLLVSDQLNLLLPTVRSRCQLIVCEAPPAAQARDWLSERVDGRGRAEELLALAGGLPLLALQMSDPQLSEQRRKMLDGMYSVAEGSAGALQIASQWSGFELPQVLQWLNGFYSDMLRWRYGAGESLLRCTEALEIYRRLPRTLANTQIFAQLEGVQGAIEAVRSGTNPNKQLLLENLLLKWRGCWPD